MNVVGVVGTDDEETGRVVGQLVERLGKHGDVGTIARTNDASPPAADDVRAAGAAVSYARTEDGAWTASGESLSLSAALDSLAQRCDYAVVEGYPDARVPQVAIGGAETRREPLLEAESAESLDVDAVIDALADAEPYETLGSLVARVKRSPEAERSGAIATFTGRVRAKDGDDDSRTTHLEFEKYEGVAEARLDDIREELEARDGVLEVRLHHRTGVIEDGEDIVFVVVLAGHRTEAFRTVEDGINRLKDEVPIFKKEITVDDEFWVHDRP